METELIYQPMTEVTEEHYELLLEADPERQLVDDYLPRSYCWEVLLAGALVGVLILLPTHPKTIEIVNISVKESHQGKGYAQQMIAYALAFAREKQADVMEIGTGTSCFEQLYIYQKCGFRFETIDRDYFVTHYTEPIIENKLILKDMVRLRYELTTRKEG